MQASFVLGINIQDNIIVAQELTHTMRKMKRRKSLMSNKIDLKKAYDRLSWPFIRNCLEMLNLPGVFISLIMACITSACFQILWNGDKSDSFLPSRGIRQCDPLSPYIFVICMKRLSHMIEEAVNANFWKPIKAGRNGPAISHLLSTNDLLFFC